MTRRRKHIRFTPSSPLPALRNTGELAEWLLLTPSELSWLSNRIRSDDKHCNRSSVHYVSRWIRKRSSGWRLIESPKPTLKSVQRRILHTILNPLPPHPLSCGFTLGKNIVDFAKPHVGRAACLKLDLKDFFTQVTAQRVHGLFRSFGFEPTVANQLALLTTVQTNPATIEHHQLADLGGQKLPRNYETLLTRRHLPQGAPTSPAIANLCAFNLDSRLAGLARSLGGVHYTRYADDLLFSGYRSFHHQAARLSEIVGAIAIEEGFELNFRKTKVMTSDQRQKAGGVVLNSRLNIDRREYDQLKATLHNCLQHGIESQNRESHPDFKAHLSGRIGWVEQINPKRGAKLRAIFEKLTSQ